MTSIFVGSGLGLYGSSVTQTNGYGAAGNSRVGQGRDQTYVNAGTGNLVVQDPDAFIAAIGLDDALTRTYNSRGTLGYNNDNWQFSFERSLSLPLLPNTLHGNITRTTADGNGEVFVWNASWNGGAGAWVSKDGSGAYDTITYTGSGYQYKQGGTGIVDNYDTTGKLLSSVDQNGNTLTYNYTGAKVTSIVDSSGQTVTLTYDTALGKTNNLLSITVLGQAPGAAQGSTASQTLAVVQYSYDSSNRLQTVKVELPSQSGFDSNVYTTTYSYDGASDRLTQIAQGDGTVLNIGYQFYGLDYRVKNVTDGAGNQTTYTYNTTTRVTTITDPLGNAVTYTYDTNGNLTQVTQPSVNGGTTNIVYSYNADGNIQQVTDAAGRNHYYSYDGDGNLTQIQDSLGNTVTRTYDAKDHLTSQTVYLTPAPAVGQSASNPQTTNYLYDGNENLRFVVSPLGEVTEYRYDSHGERITTITYPAAAYGGTLSTTALTSWAASQTQTLIHRTDTTYDATGQIQTVTAWANTDASGNGINDGKQSQSRYVYDVRGRLLIAIDPRAAASVPTSPAAAGQAYVTSYGYDGLDRIVSLQNGLGQTTSTVYGSGLTTVTAPNGLQTQTTYNAAGLATSVVQSKGATAYGTTSYRYDADERLVRTTDPAGQPTYYVYDALGRRTGVISPQKELTETVYNDDGQVTGVIQYASPVTATLTDTNGNPLSLGIAQVRPAANGLDRATRSYYDAAGRLIDVVDALGYVTQYAYDGAGNRIVQTQYYTPLTSIPTSGNAGDVNPTANAANDRVTRYFYDADNRLAGTLDADGFLSRTIYDAAGEVTQGIAYATITNASLRAGGTLAQLIPAADAVHDRSSYTVYDGQGRVAYQLDAATLQSGSTYYYLTQNSYDAAGNLSQRKRYATAITYSGSGAPTPPAANAKDQTQSWTYDALDRVTQQIDAQGTSTLYLYNATTGFLDEVFVGATGAPTVPVAQTDALGHNDERTVTYTRDDLGQVTNTLEGVAGSNTQTVYDLDGRKIQSTDADGHKTFYYYDGDGRLVYTVNGAGEVTGNVYDAFGDITQATQYATRISGTDLATLHGGLVPTASSGDSAFYNDVVNNTAFQGNAQNRVTVYQYHDNRGLLTQTTEAMGFVTSEAYDAFGELQSKTQDVGATPGASSRNDTYTYDARGSLTQSVADSGGLALTSKVLQYDAFGNALQTQDANGNITQTGYDALGRVVSVTDPLGGGTLTTYDAFDRVLSVTDPNGVVTSYNYTDSAQSLTVTNQATGIAVTTVSNRHGQSIEVTDGTGASTLYTYDADGNLKTTTDADGNLVTDNYDAADLLSSTIDADNVTTSYTYDGANRVLTRTVDPTGLNLKTQYTYNAFGQAFQVTDPNGIVTETVFDKDGRSAAVIVDTAGLKLATTYTYDGLGDTLTVTEGQQASGGTGSWTFAAAPNTTPKITQYTYDKAGRRTQQVVDPGSGHLNLTTQYFYDKDGNVVRKIDANNQTWRTVYDADNRARYTIDPAGDVVENDYDAGGRLTRTVQYATPLTGTQLSGLSDTSTVANVAALLPANPSSTTDRISWNVYDGDNRLVYSVDAAGDITGYTYDNAGRVTDTLRYANRVTTANLATLATVKAAGVAQLGIVASPSADRNSYAVYDAAGRAVYSVDALNHLTQNFYDGNGNLVQARQYNNTLPTGTATTKAAIDAAVAVAGFVDNTRDRLSYYVYDSANRQRYTVRTINTTVSGGNLTQTVYVTQTNYDGVGRVTDSYRYAKQMTLTVAASGSPSLATMNTLVGAAANQDSTNDQHDHSQYDGAGRLQVFADAGGYTQSYTYDGLGNKKTYTNQNNVTWTYTYDAAGRLSEQDSPQTTLYVQSTGSSPAPTQITAAAVTKFTYDGLGNVKTRNEGYTSSGTFTSMRITSYGYDALGRQNLTTYPSVNVYNSTTDVSAGYIGVHTTPQVSTSAVSYDAFGNATVSRDVGGQYSYKVYNTLGQLLYDIDADGYVTGYQYNAFGDQTSTTRYANKLSAGHAVGQPYSASEVVSRLTAGAADRAITTAYDQLDRKTQVTQPSIYAYDAASQTAVTTSPATSYQYDSFGDLVLQQQLKSVVSGTSNYTSTYSYYDRLGNQVATIDPMGYLTQYQYSATGKVTDKKEWATAISVYSTAGFTAPIYVAASTNNQTATVYYQSNFTQGTSGLSGTFGAAGSNFSVQNGQLVMLDTFGQSANAFVSVQGTRNYTGSNSQKVDFTFDFTVGSGSLGPGRLIGIGNWDGKTFNSATFGDYLLISGTSIGAYRVNSTGATVTTLPALTPGTAYELQVVLDATGATLYLYPQGQSRTTGVSDRYTTTFAPASIRTQLFAETVTTTSTGEAPVNFSQISETLDSGTAVNASAANLQSRSYSNLRETQYTYDRLGRETSETRIGVINTTVANGTAQATVGNLTTVQRSYDGVGNVISTTDATGAKALTFYNALGDLVAKVGPAVSFTPFTGATAQTGSSLTTYTYDALGNQLSQTQSAYGTTRALAQASPADLPTPTQVSATYDATSYDFYDPLGRVIKTLDADGDETDTSYDAYGNIAKTEQDFARLNGASTGHKVQIFTYNGRGEQIEEDTLLESGVLASNTTTYDAFGEVTDKGLAGGDQAYLQGTYLHYRYDNDGNLVYANDAGASTVYLHDLQGNTTAQITSPTLDLSTYFPASNVNSSPAAVAALTSGIRRNETVYDALGRVSFQRPATFTELSLQLHPNFYFYAEANGQHLIVNNAPPRGGSVILRLAPVGTSTWTTFTVPTDSTYASGVDFNVSTMADGLYTYQLSYTLPGPGGTTVTEAAGSGTLQLATGVGFTATAATIGRTTVNGINYLTFTGSANANLSGMTAVDLYYTNAQQPGVSGSGTISKRYAVVNLGGGVYGIPVPDTKIPTGFRPIGTAQSHIYTGGISSLGASSVPSAAQAGLALLSGLLRGTVAIGSANTTLPISGLKLVGLAVKPAGVQGSYTDITSKFTGSNFSLLTANLADTQNFDWYASFTDASGNPVDLSHIMINGQPLGNAAGQVFGQYRSAYGAYEDDDAIASNATNAVPVIYAPTQILDRWGDVISSTDADGVATTSRYDDFGNLVESKLPQVQAVDDHGNLAPVTPTSEYAYDGDGRLIASTNANGVLNTQQYNAAGELTATTDGVGSTVHYAYNAYGWQTSKTTALNYTTYYFYNLRGLLTQENDPAVTKVYQYDALGDRVNDNGLAFYTYDGYGHILIEEDPAEVDGKQQIVRYVYDSLGNLYSQTDNNGNQQIWQRDDFGRITYYYSPAPTGTPRSNYTQYFYDYTGEKSGESLVEGNNTFGELYTYYDSGLLKSVYDSGQYAYTGANAQEDSLLGGFRETDYTYTAAGRLLQERFYAPGINQNTTYPLEWQDTVYSYDADGRLATANDSNAILSYQYDAQGNRKLIQANYQFSILGGGNHVYLYDFDADNRVVNQVDADVTPGTSTTLKNAKRVTYAYDADGNRQYETDYANTSTLTVPSGGNELDTLTANLASAQQTKALLNTFDGDGRLIGTNNLNSNGTTGTLVSGRQYTQYDQVKVYTSGSTTVNYTYNADGTLRQVSGGGNPSGTYTYDSAGNLMAVANSDGSSIAYTYQLGQASGAYLQSQIAAHNGSGTNTTKQYYDYHDNLDTIIKPGSSNNEYSLVTNNAGQILVKSPSNSALISGSGNADFLIYHGSDELGDFQFPVNSLTPQANFGFNLTPVSDQYPGIAPSTYTVNGGDTLQGIAASVYGDSSLWYLIADANGIRNDGDLIAGQVLNLPNRIVDAHNSASTAVKAYNPQQIVGDVTPPFVSPPTPSNCNVLNIIVAVVVIVVATIAQQYEVDAWAAGTFSTADIGTQAAIVASSAAAGNVAGQLAGDALGVHQGLNFTDVATAAASGAITGGFVPGSAGTGFAATAARAAAASAVSQGVNMVVGQQHGFSWSAVAAAAISAGVAEEFNANVPNGVHSTSQLLNTDAAPVDFSGIDVAYNTAANFVAGVAGQGTQALLSGHGQIEFGNIATDAFGNALGSSIVGAIKQTPAERQATAAWFQGAGPNSGDAQATGQQSSLPGSSTYLSYPGSNTPQTYVPEPADGGSSLSPADEAALASLAQAPGTLTDGPMVASSRATPGALASDGGVTSSDNDYIPPALKAATAALFAPQLAQFNAEMAAMSLQDDIELNAVFDTTSALNARDFAASHPDVAPSEINPVGAGAVRILGSLRGGGIGVTTRLVGAAVGGGELLGAATGAVLDQLDFANSGYYAPDTELLKQDFNGVVDFFQNPARLDPLFAGLSSQFNYADSLVSSNTYAGNFLGGAVYGDLAAQAGLTIAGGTDVVLGAGNLALRASGLSALRGPYNFNFAQSDFEMGGVDISAPEFARFRDLQIAPDAHAYTKHGGWVSDSDLQLRAWTGIAPGSTAPSFRYPGVASAFHSDTLLDYADSFVRSSGILDAELAANPGKLDFNINPLKIGDLGVDLGRGYVPVNPYAVVGPTLFQGPLLRIDSMTSVGGYYRYNPVTLTFDRISLYPAVVK